MLRSVIALILVALGVMPVHAQMYRWVDQDGRVHFGDHPPPGQGERLQHTPAPPPDDAPAPQGVPDRQRLLDMYQREREERRAAKQQAAREKAQQRRDCDEVAGTLRRYRAGGPLYEDKPDGTRYYFTAAEKDAEMAQLRAYLDRQCGGVPADLQLKQGR